jgi:hypothetical protein
MAKKRRKRQKIYAESVAEAFEDPKAVISLAITEDDEFEQFQGHACMASHSVFAIHGH